jgi:hypothetical protein
VPPDHQVRGDGVADAGLGDARLAQAWRRALVRFRRAEAALAAVAHTEDDDLYDRLLGRFSRALRHLVRTPAPDLPAFAAKLDLAIDQEVASLTGGAACMTALKRDAGRLCRGAAAPAPAPAPA